MDSGPDIRTYIAVIKRRLPVTFATFVVVMACAVAAAILWPPVYQSQARLIVETQQIPDDLVRATVRTIADERLQVIKQRVTTRDVLLGIVEKFRLFPNERDSLTPTRLVEEMRNRTIIEKFELGGSRRARREAVIIGLTVAFEDRSPNTAQRVANEFVTLILGADVKTRTAQASETTRFLQRETDERRRQLTSIEAKISAYKLQNVGALPEKRQVLERQHDQAKSERDALDRAILDLSEKLQLTELELKVRRAGNKTRTVLGTGAALSVQDLGTLKKQLAVKRTLYTDNHPDIRSLLNQIAALESQQSGRTNAGDSQEDQAGAQRGELTLEERLLRGRISALKQREAQAAKKRNEVAKNMDRIQNLIAQIPGVEEVLRRFSVESEAIRKDLEDLTAKLRQAKIGERLESDRQAERFEVIEQPIRPTEPIRPNRPLILAAGLGAAVAAAFAVMLILELLNRTVRSNVDIVRAIEQAPLGTIPYYTTSTESRRQRTKIILGILSLVLVITVALVAIHFFYLPVDEVYYKVLQRFNLHNFY